MCILNNHCALLNLSNSSNLQKGIENITKKIYSKDLCIQYLALPNLRVLPYLVLLLQLKKKYFGEQQTTLSVQMTGVPKDLCFSLPGPL